MKIKSLHIEDYKIFKNFDIDFCGEDGLPLPLIVLAGENGTGKSTLLEYLSEPLNYRQFDNNDKNAVDLNLSDKNGLNIDLKSENLIVQNITDYLKTRIEHKVLSLNDISNKDENLKTSILHIIDSLIFEKGFLPFDAYLELSNRIQKYLKIFDVNFKFSSRDSDKKLFFKSDIKEIFEFRNLSLGEKKLLKTIVYLKFNVPKARLILFDEPEDSLHPKWQNHIVNLYKTYAEENNCQVIMATHSPFIIGSAPSESIRVLERTEDGIKAISPNEGYGWKVDKVLSQIMGTYIQRAPEVEKQFEYLREKLKAKDLNGDFNEKLNELAAITGNADMDIFFLRKEIKRLQTELNG